MEQKGFKDSASKWSLCDWNVASGDRDTDRDVL